MLTTLGQSSLKYREPVINGFNAVINQLKHMSNDIINLVVCSILGETSASGAIALLVISQFSEHHPRVGEQVLLGEPRLHIDIGLCEPNQTSYLNLSTPDTYIALPYTCHITPHCLPFFYHEQVYENRTENCTFEWSSHLALVTQTINETSRSKTTLTNTTSVEDSTCLSEPLHSLFLLEVLSLSVISLLLLILANSSPSHNDIDEDIQLLCAEHKNSSNDPRIYQLDLNEEFKTYEAFKDKKEILIQQLERKLPTECQFTLYNDILSVNVEHVLNHPEGKERLSQFFDSLVRVVNEELNSPTIRQ